MRRRTSASSLPTTIVTIAEKRSSAGSRPSRSQASAKRARRSRTSSTEALKVLYSSAQRAAGSIVPRPAPAADDQRRVRLLHRLRQGVELLDPVVLALERERARLPRAVHDLDLLGEDPEARAHVVEREAVGAVLRLEPAGADAELHPPAGDVVGGDDRLGEQRRMPERRRRHQRAEPDPRGDRREAGERRPGVERAAPLYAHHGRVVVGAEERLDAGALGGGGDRLPLLPGHVLLALDHQTDAHAPERIKVAQER